MSEHIAFMRNATSEQLVTLKNEIRERKRHNKTVPKIESKHKTGPSVFSIREEAFRLHDGETRKIRRIFAKGLDSGDYSRVGWILACDVDCCMVCHTAMGVFLSKHHCRACGNVVCYKCSSEKAKIAQLPDDVGPVRVCVQCYFGQTEVSATINDTVGVVIADVGDAPMALNVEDTNVVNLHQYGKIILSEADSVFAFKTRRRDRSVVYVNVRTCSDVPCNLENQLMHSPSQFSPQRSPNKPGFEAPDKQHNATNVTDDKPPPPAARPGLTKLHTNSFRMPSATPTTVRAIYMVGAPRGDLSTSYTPASGGGHRRVPDSIYEIAVNPRVIQEAKVDRTGAKKSMICEQALEFLSEKCGEDEFAYFQYVNEDIDGEEDGEWKVVCVTEESLKSKGGLSFSGKTSGDIESDDESNNHSNNNSGNNGSGNNLHMQNPKNTHRNTSLAQSPVNKLSIAVPSPLAFRKHHQILCSCADITACPPLAETEVGFDDCGGSPNRQYVSMEHRMKASPLQSDNWDGTHSSKESRSVRFQAAINSDTDTRTTTDGSASSHTPHAHTKSITFTGLPGFVIKTRRSEDHINAQVVKSTRGGGGGTHHGFLSSTVGTDAADHGAIMRVKVFINVLHHSNVDELLANNTVSMSQSEKPLIVMGETVKHTRDSKGQQCLLYTVAVGSEYFIKKPQDKKEVKISHPVNVKKIIRAVSSKFVDCLSDETFSLPHVRGNCKGGRIELMTYTFGTPSSDPATAGNIVQANMAKTTQKVDGGSQQPATTKTGDTAETISGESDQSHDNNHKQQPPPRRATLLTAIFSPPVSEPAVRIVGRELITSEDMLEYIASLSLEEAGAKLLKQASAKDASVLLGWQVIFPNERKETGDGKADLDVYVVTGIRKSALRKTEYRISGKHRNDHWTLLKRTDAKAGVVFWPLRKVLFLEEPVDVVPKTGAFLASAKGVISGGAGGCRSEDRCG